MSDLREVHQPATIGYPPVYRLSLVLFVVALLGVITLVLWDVWHLMTPSIIHQRLDALPLNLIGLSYIAMLAGTRKKRSEKIKGMLLGVAFVFWGCEQLLPPSRLATALDEGAVAIFVIDLGLIIFGHLMRLDAEAEAL